jgi:hypothetical protein
VTSGILGAASMRVGVRRFLPRAPRWARKVTDAEAAAFVASLAPATSDDEPAAPRRAEPARDEGGASDTRVLAGR